VASPKNSHSSNLTDLIRQAERAVADTSARAARMRVPAEKASFQRRYFVATGAFLALCTAVYVLWQGYAPPSKARVAQDLERVLDMAKASVDAAKSSSGALPAAIPNASLAAVVVYEPDQQGYKLSTTVMGVRVTLERDGSKTRDVSGSK
jgi:hypothetical protein